LGTHGDVKKTLHDYQGVLPNFKKVYVLERNNAFTLRTHKKIKTLVNDHQETLENCDKVDILKSKD
jgi:hypothetical protein